MSSNQVVVIERCVNTDGFSSCPHTASRKPFQRTHGAAEARHTPVARPLLPPTPRVALIFSGFLQNTCMRGAGVWAILQQVEWCRTAVGQCDVFLHTWQTLSKASGFEVHGANWTAAIERHVSTSRRPVTPPSSLPCVHELRERANLTDVEVDQQRVPSTEELRAGAPWGVCMENLLNMRAQVASMLGGLGLMALHEASTGRPYHAVVRMRADIGVLSEASRVCCFPTQYSWSTLAQRAKAVARGTLDVARSNEMVTCHHPRNKRTDFCQWSAPPDPLRRTLEELRGDRFDLLVYGASASEGRGVATGSISSGKDDELIDVAGELADAPPAPPRFARGSCLEYLNRSDVHIIAVSENILYCAMNRASVSPSKLVDFRGYDQT
jgi:hypothetical protein